MQAIETRYAGCRFRSRLEARWAVFLDALHIAWHYELEGFELPSGRYLPDFFLPASMVWLEIKGPQPSNRDTSKMVELAALSGTRCRVLAGDIPRPEDVVLLEFGRGPIPVLPCLVPRPGYLVVDDSTNITQLANGGLAVDIEAYNAIPTEHWELEQAAWGLSGYTLPEIQTALEAARSARFE